MTREELRREIAEYQMPKAPVGSPVLWYRTGRANCDPMIAYMLHCGGRTCQLFLADGRRQDSVRHIDDPKLNLSVEQRESGSWDFTHGEKDLAAYKQTMEERVKALESKVEQLEAALPRSKSEGGKKKPVPSRGNPNNLKEYRDLQDKAEELGIDRNMKKVELQRAIARAEGKMVQSTVTPVPDRPVSSPWSDRPSAS